MIRLIAQLSSAIGPIIPPSIVMVVLGRTAEISIGKLFAGGLVPGILMGLSLMVVIYINSHSGKIYFPPKQKRATVGEIWTSFKKTFFAISSPLIILGDIFTGVITPTKVGAVVVFYPILVSFVYKEIRIKDIPVILKEAAFSIGVAMFIVAAVQLFAWVITSERIAINAYEDLIQFTTQKWLILLLMNIILFIMGFFLEGISVIMIAVPLFFPIANSLQIDPIHFGMIVCVNVMLGLLTPPVGISVYIASDIAKVPVGEVFRRIYPFLISLVVILLLVTYIPGISLILPKLIFG